MRQLSHLSVCWPALASSGIFCRRRSRHILSAVRAKTFNLRDDDDDDNIMMIIIYTNMLDLILLLLKLKFIVHHSLRISPASRYTLQSVNSFSSRDFVAMVRTLLQLHINSFVLHQVPNPVSVRRLVFAAVRGSSLALEL